MKRNFSDYIVALAVIACSLLLLLALTFALSGYHLNQPARLLQIDYQDVTGIKVHSEVRYAGAPAGRVIGMRHLTPDERKAAPNKLSAVRLSVSIDPSIPPLPANCIASLGADTLLGEKFIALSAGTADAGTLANNAVIEGHPAYGIEELTRAAGPLLDNANTLLTNANGMVTNVKGQLAEIMPNISALTVSVQGVSKNADLLLGRATKLITDNESGIKMNLGELQAAIKGIKELLKNADGMIGRTDAQIQEQMKELRVVLLNLKVVSTYTKGLTQDLGEKPSRLIFSGKPHKLTPESEILDSGKPLPAKAP